MNSQNKTNESSDYDIIVRLERLIRILEKTKSFVYGIKVFEAHRELNGCIAGLEKPTALEDEKYVAHIIRKMKKIDSFVVSMEVFDAYREIASLIADLNHTKDKLFKKTMGISNNSKGEQTPNEE